MNTVLNVLEKYVLGSAVRRFAGLLIGSLSFGLILETASYFYAYSHGIRIPVDTIPYSPLFSAVIGLAVIAITLSTITLVFFVIEWVKIPPERYLRSIRSLILGNGVVKRFAGIVLLFGYAAVRGWGSVLIAAGLIMIIVLLPFSLLGIEKQSIEQIFSSITSDENAVLLIAIGAVIFLVYFSIKAFSEQFSPLVFSVFLSLVLILAGLASLYNPAVYGSLLRTTGYGGGTFVRIIFGERCKQEIVGNLLLRTQYAVFITDKEPTKYRYRDLNLEKVCIIDIDVHSNALHIDHPKRPSALSNE